MEQGGRSLEPKPLRTPRAAAVAGIAFSLLLIASLVLLDVSVPANLGQVGSWLANSHRRSLVVAALYLVPFAGIAFLWFIGVLRDRVGTREDRFFSTVFLGSGLLFVAMIFVGAATGAGLIAAVASSPSALEPGTLLLGRQVTSVLLTTYAMRMAAVFTITTATISLRTGIVARWIPYAGYPVAVVLLFGVGLSRWIVLLFPVWILVLSIEILLAQLRAPPAPAAQ